MSHHITVHLTIAGAEDDAGAALREADKRLRSLLNEWMCEPPLEPPYPPGSLLHYSFANGFEEIRMQDGAVPPDLDHARED